MDLYGIDPRRNRINSISEVVGMLKELDALKAMSRERENVRRNGSDRNRVSTYLEYATEALCRDEPDIRQAKAWIGAAEIIVKGSVQ